MIITPAGGGPARRFVALDSLRGVCAIGVALFHFETVGLLHRANIVQNGQDFVDFFFVLSGFVIAGAYRRRLARGLRVRDFLLLRLGRIYPLHATMLLLLLAMTAALAVIATGADGEGVAHRTFTFVLVSTFLQIFSRGNEFAWNGPSWSVAAEMWTYAIFAALFRRAGRWIIPASLLIATACCCYIAALPAPIRYLPVASGLARSVAGFALGVVVGDLRDRSSAFALRSSGARTASAIECATLLAIVAMLCLPPGGAWRYLHVFAYAAAVLVFANDRGVISRLLAKRPARLLGLLSYSIYMTHVFVQRALYTLLDLAQRHTGVTLVTRDAGHRVVHGGEMFANVTTVAMLALVLAMSFLTFRLVEEPARRWSRGRIMRRSSVGRAVRPDEARKTRELRYVEQR